MDQVPTLIHPALVHFAIVLPIMIVLLELVNIIVKRSETADEPKGRGVSTLSFILVLSMVAIFALTYITGSVDGKEALDTLSKAGQAELAEHKLIGAYLVYGSLALLLFKLIALISGVKGRVLFLVLAIAFAGSSLKQGKDGGELVYKYGSNVETKAGEAKIKVAKIEAKDKEEAVEATEEFTKEAKADETKTAQEPKEMTDSVAQEQSKAIKTPTKVKGEESAKAQVEETQSKDQSEAKEATEEFAKEAKSDKTKTAQETKEMTDSVAQEESKAIETPTKVKGEESAKAQVEETQSKDNFEAKEATEEFAKEAKADEEKIDTPVSNSAE
jgi:uncharacterized membrane protein